jgi:hypothetical protein
VKARKNKNAHVNGDGTESGTITTKAKAHLSRVRSIRNAEKRKDVIGKPRKR